MAFLDGARNFCKRVAKSFSKILCAGHQDGRNDVCDNMEEQRAVVPPEGHIIDSHAIPIARGRAIPVAENLSIATFRGINGLKSFTSMQSCITELVCSSNLGTRCNAVEEYRARNPTVNHFLQVAVIAPEPGINQLAAIHVDHIFECQLLSHCIMQTKCLHKIIRKVKISESMTNQLYDVQNMLKPLKQLHNGLNTEASCLNLQLMDANLNILKGKAISDFIERQLSGTGGPVNFGSYLNDVKPENYGADLKTLAAEIARSVKNVRDPYLGYIRGMHIGGVGDRAVAKLRDGLIQTIDRVFDNLLDDAMIADIAALNAGQLPNTFENVIQIDLTDPATTVLTDSAEFIIQPTPVGVIDSTISPTGSPTMRVEV